MHLLLDLGQLCAAKMRGQDSPAFVVRNVETKKDEARISCVAVEPGGKKTKILLCMEPLVLSSYQAVHGSVKPGDPLQINVTGKEFLPARRAWGGDYVYLKITTDTLTRAPLAQQAQQTHPEAESTTA